MINQVEIIPNELPELLTAGRYEVTRPWVHRQRQMPIHTMLLVTKGTVYINEDGHDVAVPKNHVFFFKSGCLQKGYRAIEAGASWYWISFAPQEVGENVIQLPKLLSVPDGIIRSVAAIENLYRRHSPYNRERLSGMLYTLFYELLSVERGGVRKETGSMASRVMTLLDQQLETGYDSEALADALGMNYSYIGKCFKAETGQTIHEAYDHLKVERARHLMLRGDMNITQVSEVLGYPNPYYFSRVFKKVTGMAPRDYMKQLYY